MEVICILNKYWSLLNLELSGLEKVKQALTQQNEGQAFKELAIYFSNRKKGAFFQDVQKVLPQLKKEEFLDTITRAELLAKQTYIFDKPWDMEKCFEPIHFPKEIDWHYQYNGDPEWMFMLNRQNFLFDLVLSYTLTKRKEFLTAYTDFVSSWQKSENTFEGRENTSWRTIDTGIRLKNWVKQLEYLLPQNCLSGEYLLDTLGFIWKQLNYLLVDTKYEWHLSQSNWRILEWHGAFIAATFFPELKDALSFKEMAKNRLEKVLPLQVTASGLQWEQSFMYHHEVFLNALEAFQVAEINHDAFSPNFKNLLIKMLSASTQLTAPGYQQPAFGDSDTEDMRQILTLGALILKPKKLNTYGFLKTVTRDLILDYGPTAEEDLATLKETIENDETLDFAHEENGLYFVRDSWNTQGNFLLFSNDYSGGGHGHSDLLHIELHMNGEPILVDSGRFTYVEENPKRQFFKDAKRHNTLVLDEKEFIQQKGSWGYSQLANQIKRPVKLNQKVVFLQGTHLGYGPEAVLNRKIIYLKEENLYLLFDEIFTDSFHKYQQHFHFPTISLNQEGEQIFYKTASNNFSIRPLDGQLPRIRETEISPSYNELQTTQKVIFEKETTGLTHLGLLFSDEKNNPVTISKIPVRGKGNFPFSETYISGYHLKTIKNEYLFVTLHFELPGISRNLFMLKDVPVFGKTVLCKKVGEEFQPIVLEG